MTARERISELIATWQQRIAVCERISRERAEADELHLAQAWHEEAQTLSDCVSQLQAILAESPDA